MKNYYTTLSEEIFSITKSQGDSTLLRRQLFYIRQTKLEKSLNTDDLKKTFWLNIYYAFFYIISKETENHNAVYTSKRIKIAHSLLSLNDIEHGILRKTKFKTGFGYITNPFYSDFIKTQAVKKLDFRIHFALKSICLKNPTIDYYESEIVNEQLQKITIKLINSETHFDTDLKLIKTSKFLFVYYRDFGGMNSVKELLQKTLEKDTKGYKFQFKNI